MFRLMIAALLLNFCVVAQAEPIPVKVVVVSMFEHGEIEGDTPGEFQFWAERWPLSQSIPFPAGEYELRMSKDGVLGICTGGGIPNATASSSTPPAPDSGPGRVTPTPAGA